MAKTKKMSTNTPTDLQNTDLLNTLQINGETYNITATKADTAEKVQAALTITKKKVDEKDDESVTFNGKDPVGVSVVPAEGGKFTGPILVPNLGTSNAYASQVINKTDTNNLINEIVAALRGLPNYVWKNKELTPELDQNQNYKALKIISTENANDYTTFKEAYETAFKDIPEDKYPYIFICKDTGDIWLKTADLDSVNITEKIKDSLIGDTPDGVNVKEFTLSFLYNELKELSDLLTANSTELDNLIKLEDLINKVDKKVTDLLGKTNDSSTSITIYGTRKYAETLSDNLSLAITNITNGTTTVEHSKQSDKIKVQTADGKTKYYSTIYFGSSAPASSLGNDGDIYIRIP